MAFASQQGVKERNCTILTGTVKKVRLSKFSTPSSFYIQLIEEDGEYNALEEEMEEYYTPKRMLTYFKNSRCMQAKNNFEFELPKLKIHNLQVRRLYKITF